MEIKIRKATINDISKIADIKIEGWQASYRGIIDDNFLDNMDRNEEIEKRKNNIESGAQIIVAENEKEIVGFCLYRNYNKEPENYPNADCEISSLYVKSSLKRNGIGKKLMQYVINELKSEGKTQMILGCLKENFPSRTFYEKMGGNVIRNSKVKFGDKEYEIVIYEYDIQNMKKDDNMQKHYANVDSLKSKNVIEAKQELKSINEKDFIGDVYFKHFIKMKEPRILENGVCFQDTNYKWIEFYDYSSKVRLTAMYNENNEIIEWYFDIARVIGKENNIPYEDDLYLDIVVTSTGKIILLDEDELKEAYERKEVTKKECDEAYKIANDLMEILKGKNKELKEFTDKYLQMFL